MRKEKAQGVKAALEDLKVSFIQTPRVSIVSAVGDGLSASVDTLSRFLEALHETQTECLLLCSNSL